MSEYITVWVDDLPDLKRGEEIVRCRDCKHYYAHGVPTCQRNKEWYTGYDINGTYGEWCDGEFYVEPDGFCAWAERREA